MTEEWKPVQADFVASKERGVGLQHPSIEIFPSPTIGERVIRVLGGTGTTINVTSSPNSGIEATIDLSRKLVSGGFTVVPHIGAKEIRDEAHLTRVSGEIADLGIDEVFVVKGEGEIKGKYRTAAQLMQGLGQTSLRLRAIGIAGYPEGIEGMTEQQLLHAIKTREKLAYTMGAELRILTQMCFDERKIMQYAVNLRDNSIDAQLAVGLPIPENMRKLHEIAVRCGVGKSRDSLLLEDPDSQYSPQNLAQRVVESDSKGLVFGFHIYTFNKILKLKELMP